MTSPAGLLYDPLLNVLAAQVDDIERLRIASENRYRQLTRAEPDEDGITRGLGLPEDHREVLKVRATIDGLTALETDTVRVLERHMRYSPWADWLKSATGVGEKTLARLLAAIGDPYWHPLEQRPRQVSELWSFAGYGNARAQVRRKGQKANWSSEARKRLYVMSDVCKRQADDTRYRRVYLDTRARYAESVHDGPCAPCGQAGLPAKPGRWVSPGAWPWTCGVPRRSSAGFRGFIGLGKLGARTVSKQILLDLWVEARRLHDEMDPAVSAT